MQTIDVVIIVGFVLASLGFWFLMAAIKRLIVGIVNFKLPKLPKLSKMLPRLPVLPSVQFSRNGSHYHANERYNPLLLQCILCGDFTRDVQTRAVRVVSDYDGIESTGKQFSLPGVTMTDQKTQKEASQQNNKHKNSGKQQKQHQKQKGQKQPKQQNNNSGNGKVFLGKVNTVYRDGHVGIVKLHSDLTMSSSLYTKSGSVLNLQQIQHDRQAVDFADTGEEVGLQF
ncbi:hypothetical protein LCGC14_2498170, partial [marine sediment metagenome]